MSELVVCINRNELAEQGVGIHGIYPFNFERSNQHNYALLPRVYADNKSDRAIDIGATFPQILGYFQIVDPRGHVLAYQRKGKEEGLFGKWSIGVGGHVSQEDLCEVMVNEAEDFPQLSSVIFAGAQRELWEEINIELTDFEEIANEEEFLAHAENVLVSMNDKTSSVHVGLPMTLALEEWQMDELKLDPSEFCNYKWMTVEELKAVSNEFETWSKILIESY